MTAMATKWIQHDLGVHGSEAILYKSVSPLEQRKPFLGFAFIGVDSRFNVLLVEVGRLSSFR